MYLLTIHAILKTTILVLGSLYRMIRKGKSFQYENSLFKDTSKLKSIYVSWPIKLIKVTEKWDRKWLFADSYGKIANIQGS